MTRLLVIDTETGGLDPDQHSILSLGGVVWDDGVLGDSFEVRIDESTVNVTKGALERNKIDLRTHLEGAHTPSEAMESVSIFIAKNFPELAARGEKVVLASQNIRFEAGFLNRLCRLAKCPFEGVFSYRMLDTASLLRFLVMVGTLPLKEPGLDAAFKYFFGIEPDDPRRHTALGDAKLTAELLTELVELVRKGGVRELVRQ